MARPRQREPASAPPFPTTLEIGGFTLEVDTVVRTGTWYAGANEFRNASGTAWLSFDCVGAWVRPLEPRPGQALPKLRQSLEVVSNVENRQTQISFVEAQRIKPDVEIGQSLAVEMSVRQSQLQEIVQLGTGVLGWLEQPPASGHILVQFKKATVLLDGPGAVIGQIVDGEAVYPVPRRPFPVGIEIDVDGFTLVISTLHVTPSGATGSVVVQLPGGIASVDSCEPATLELGVIDLPPSCGIYVDAPAEQYGPWMLGDTGLEIEGTGYVLDLRPLPLFPPFPPLPWTPPRGLRLAAGTATGENTVPDPCNTGYLRGHYTYASALIVADGFKGLIELEEPCSFHALNPRGDIVTLRAGWLDLTQSEIVAGEFGPGDIELPRDAVCQASAGTKVVMPFGTVNVQPNLDLSGVVDYAGLPISWGELTHHGAEVIAWTARVGTGYVYLPAGAVPSYFPESGGTFSGPSISSIVDASLTALAAKNVSGVTFAELKDASVLSPDRPGGTGNPLKLQHLAGWLRIASRGVDGELLTYNALPDERLGEPARPGYVGITPFAVDLFVNDKRTRLAQFVTSAVFDADLGGRFKIPPPCDLVLQVEHIQITSTAHLVGGDVGLPIGGVPLGYWQVSLVPTGQPSQAGVASMRTGRIVFTAAGIAEPRHFATPFSLTWGEMLADGNLGELDLDFNNYGQQFDGIPYSPHRFELSKYVAGTTDPYLATCGTVHFPFFGPSVVNIRDAVDSTTAAPFFGRIVTVPKAGIDAGWEDTDLTLVGTWQNIVSSDLAHFHCPDAQVDYNNASQNGFIGSGTADIGFFNSDGLTAEVEIHSGATDIHMSSAETHDVDLGLLARMSAIGEVGGCARIEGPLLKRMSFYGLLEASAAGGTILVPKAGYEAEIDINVTPASLDYYCSGDMLLSLGLEDIEVSASTHLLLNFATASAEGEVIGRIDCDSVSSGLSGEGQVTWHVGPTMHYLQGRMKVTVCDWTESGGMEGGFFVGNQVPKQLAWVLEPTNPHFGVSQAILPSSLTGVFGYGQLSRAVSFWVYGGSVDIYAGMGAFSLVPPGMSPAFGGVVGLPYVVGACGIYAHGEILGGLVSASAWGNLSLRGPLPVYFEGRFGLEGCVAWVLCASVEVTADINDSGISMHT
jgi:hypothetical protein